MVVDVNGEEPAEVAGRNFSEFLLGLASSWCDPRSFLNHRLPLPLLWLQQEGVRKLILLFTNPQW